MHTSVSFKISETDIVVRLGHELIKRDIPFVCEHRVKVGDRYLRADLAVHRNNTLICLIEVKNHKKLKARKVTKQEIRYQ
jgi:hypothetical protein